MTGVKAAVPASLSIRPTRAFDEQAGGWCAFHGQSADTTHIASVLVNGHYVMVAGVCDACAVLMRDGTDWFGKAPRAADRAVRQ